MPRRWAIIIGVAVTIVGASLFLGLFIDDDYFMGFAALVLLIPVIGMYLDT